MRDESARIGAPPVVAIVGPTAVGKSRLALQLAAESGGAILSADSRQVYRYMDIGTAKPTKHELADVTHFMIDVVAPDQTYSARLFRDEGLRVLQRLAGQQRPVFVVGGTGFYMRALLDGLALPAVPPNPELRARLVEEAQSLGPTVLHARLGSLDPASADRIHPHNLPRVLRALEIVEQLGGPVPPSDQGTAVPALYLGLRKDRNRLKEAADRRVLAQVDAGLIEETRLLLAMGYRPDLPALQGFGYKQVISHLAGDVPLAEAVRAYQVATHQYIRRQTTWFGNDDRVMWLEAGESAISQARTLVSSWLNLGQCDRTIVP